MIVLTDHPPRMSIFGTTFPLKILLLTSVIAPILLFALVGIIDYREVANTSSGAAKETGLLDWVLVEPFALVAFGALIALALVSWFAFRRARREEASLADLQREIARREEAELKLRRSEARYRAYFEHAPESLFVFEVGADGNFRYEAHNPAAARTSGTPNSDLAGRTIAETLPAHLVDRVTNNFRRCVAAGAPIRYEETLAFPPGTVTSEVILVPVNDETGRIAWIMGSARDITETRKAQDELRRAQRMEAVGQLTGGVAHDFNNLLTIIAGNIDFALSDLANEDLGRRLRSALRAAERGASLTRHLLTFSRRQMLRPEIVLLQRRVEEMTGFLRGAVRDDIRLILDLAPDLWAIQVDLGEFDLAILNITLNGRDAMPNGGTLRIEGRNLSFVQGSAENGELQGEFVAFAISDSGRGMPPEVLGQAFEPFFTTKGVGSGSGLGLSQVYGFARQSGGLATITSTPEQGTTVTLFLPRAAEADAGVEPPHHEPPMIVVSHAVAPVAFVVEDDTDVAAFAASVLAEMNFVVRTAHDAREALLCLEKDPAVDVVLSDIVMPGDMSGLDFAQELWRRNPSTAVLLTTGYSDQVSAAVAKGFRVLAKPYQAKALKIAIHEVYKAAALSE